MTRTTEQFIEMALSMTAFAALMMFLTAIITLCVKLAIFLFTF